ncbi:MAG TPA: aldehyde dehydrogenase family protein [Trebonia sp.]|nr:aldehyde dehydrogenase family protein [Trebonia sp.]
MEHPRERQDRAGRLIVAAAAGNLKKASLELGGKSPNIVFEDASPEAVTGAANAIFFNHGQCCVAGSRLFVQQNRFDEVIEGVAQIAKSTKLGQGMEPSTQMGPLVSAEQLQRVTGYLDSGLADGATAVTGGSRHGEAGYVVESTVLTNVRPDMKVVREEIFGPVVAAAPFSSLDDIAAAVIRGRQAPAWLARHGLAARLVDRSGLVVTVGGWPQH